MSSANTGAGKTTETNVYNNVYGDNSSIKTIINYFIGNTPLNKIFALVLFIISTFSSLSEIISYTFTDFAMLVFKTENFNFSPNIAVTCCQLFSCFIWAVAINRKMPKKTILPSLFFILTTLIKLLIEMHLLTINLIYCCLMLFVAFSIILLMIYDSIEKKISKQE